MSRRMATCPLCQHTVHNMVPLSLRLQTHGHSWIGALSRSPNKDLEGENYTMPVARLGVEGRSQDFQMCLI